MKRSKDNPKTYNFVKEQELYQIKFLMFFLIQKYKNISNLFSVILNEQLDSVVILRPIYNL